MTVAVHKAPAPVVIQVLSPVNVTTQVLVRNDAAHVLVAGGGPLVKLGGRSQLDSLEVESSRALANNHRLPAGELPRAGLEGNLRMALTNLEYRFVGIHVDSISAFHHRANDAKGRLDVGVGVTVWQLAVHS